MILADSNIFIDLWKHKNINYQKVLPELDLFQTNFPSE